MRILVTGASGFIGRKLIGALKADSDTEVFALSANKNIEISGVHFYRCNVLDADGVEKVFSENTFDCVVHLAAVTAHSEIIDNKIKTFEINLHGTINLLNSFNRHCRSGQFIYASSGKVYGKTNEMPISENAILSPTNILGKTKRMTEEVIDFYAQQENRYLILRIFNVYGEGQRSNFVVPTIIAQLAKKEISLGNIKDLRDYIYIGDLIDAFKACIAHPKAFANIDYVNVGSGEPVSVADILREIETLTNRKLTVTVNPQKLRHDEMSVEYCNNNKLTKLTGWFPKHSLASGLKSTLKNEGIIFLEGANL